MHTEGQTYRSVNHRGYCIFLMLVLVSMLFGCTASRTTRQVLARSRGPSPVLPVTATYRLEEIRPASMGDTTQVIITVSGPVQPLVQRLSQPDRLAIDLPETQLPPQWKQPKVPVSDGRLQTIQVTQSQPKRVQVILALQAIEDYHITVQSAPHRVTVELLGAVTALPPSAGTAKKGAPRVNPAEPSLQAKLSPRAHRQPIICIDPGHGGHDPGALGPTGLAEKTVVLQVAKELRQLIQQEMPQYRVVLTRDQDVFLPLAERARMANEQQAHVFISIHANSSPHREASGIETWYLSFAASARAKQIAARENMMSEKQLSFLEHILRDMHETDRINQSAGLAQSTQRALAEHMAAHYPGVIPRGVEGAPFAVLYRTTMPSVLVETAFISNPQEEARLRTPQYQRALARGLLRGLRQFLQTTVMAVY
jgi:N-acetylmuramoyl-L-alanine amidase